MDDSSISPSVSPTRMYHSAHQGDESSSTVDIASFVSMIKSNSEKIKLEAASALLHVLSMNHVNTVVMCGAIPVLLVALESPKQSVRDECVKCLSVIISSSPIHRNCVIQGGGLSALLQCIDNSTGDVSLNILLEGLSKFCNHRDRPSCASLDPFLPQIIRMLDARHDANVIIQCSKFIAYLADGSPQIVKALLRHGAKKCLMQLLSHSEESVVVSVLRASRYLVPPREARPACDVPVSPIKVIKPNMGSIEKEWTLSPMMSAELVAQYSSEMPEIDIVVCQNVELFKASEQDVSSMAMMLGVSIVASQVGIRCRHCSKTPFASDKIVFPASINSMTSSIRHIAFSHFTSCSRISPHTKAKIAELTNTGCAVKNVDKQEDYYARICNMNGVHDLSDQRTGIVLSGAKESCNTAQKPRVLRFETPSSTSTQHSSIIQPPSNNSSLHTPMVKKLKSTTSGALAVPFQAFRRGSTNLEQGGFMPMSTGIWKCMQCVGSNIKLLSSVWEGNCSPPVAYVETHLRECPESDLSANEDHDDGALNPKQYPSDTKGGQSGMVDKLVTLECSDTPDVHDIHENSSLVKEEDKALLTDYVALFMDQFKICHYKKSVHGGKSALPEGFPGLVCKHCSGDKKARYFFWSSPDRFKNNNSNFPAHLLRCAHCPDTIKHQLTTMKPYHYHQMKHLSRGSLTTFFRRIYGRLQVPEEPSSKPIFSEKAPVEIQRKPSGDDSPVDSTGIDIPPSKNSSEDKFQTNSISMPDDFDWLTEKECYLRKNLEFFCITDSDVRFFGTCPDAKLPRIGQIGARCIHCAQQMRCKGLSDPRVFRLFSSVKNIRATVLDFQEHLSHCQLVSSHCNQVFKSPLTTHTVRIVAEYYERCHFNLGLIDDRGMVRSLPQKGNIIIMKSSNSDSANHSNSCETVHAMETGDMDTYNNESPLLPSVTPLERGRKRDFVTI